MAELALTDRLQPALLDRLLDDERSVVLVKIATTIEALEQLSLSANAFSDILRTQGLTAQKQSRHGSVLEMEFTAMREHASPATLRSLVINPPGAPKGIALQSFATVESSVVPNSELESAERRMISMRRLRECVHRDLGWLFNSVNLDSTQDLSAVPHVAASVVNFGLPSFAGRMTSSIDENSAAERLRRTIELFEPRLSAVRVVPRPRTAGDGDGTLEFSIEAELWGQPVSQHLQLRTTIDVMSGDVTVAEERGARA